MSEWTGWAPSLTVQHAVALLLVILLKVYATQPRRYATQYILQYVHNFVSTSPAVFNHSITVFTLCFGCSFSNRRMHSGTETVQSVIQSFYGTKTESIFCLPPLEAKKRLHSQFRRTEQFAARPMEISKHP